MNKPLAKVGSRPVSRAASVNSRAARWPADIFEVSMSTLGSASAGLTRGSTGGGFVSIICSSRVKSFSVGSQIAQKRARFEFGEPLLDEALHVADQPGRAQGVRVTQRSAAERG